MSKNTVSKNATKASKQSKDSKQSKLIQEMATLSANRLMVRFEHPSMDQSFVNALRRILIGELKTYSLMAHTKISKNTTSFNNEFILSRIQMIPVKINDTSDLEWLERNLIFRFCDDNNWEDPIINEGDLDLHLSEKNRHFFHAQQPTQLLL